MPVDLLLIANPSKSAANVGDNTPPGPEPMPAGALLTAGPTVCIKQTKIIINITYLLTANCNKYLHQAYTLC